MARGREELLEESYKKLFEEFKEKFMDEFKRKYKMEFLKDTRLEQFRMYPKEHLKKSAAIHAEIADKGTGE